MRNKRLPLVLRWPRKPIQIHWFCLWPGRGLLLVAERSAHRSISWPWHTDVRLVPKKIGNLLRSTDLAHPRAPPHRQPTKLCELDGRHDDLRMFRAECTPAKISAGLRRGSVSSIRSSDLRKDPRIATGPTPYVEGRGHLADPEGTLVERLGFGVAAMGIIQPGQVVQRRGDIRMVGAQHPSRMPSELL